MACDASRQLRQQTDPVGQGEDRRRVCRILAVGGEVDRLRRAGGAVGARERALEADAIAVVGAA
jgi:hypothetical protein